MSNFFIASSSIAGAARASVMRLQTDLARSQKEIASGRSADLGLARGTGLSEMVSLRQALTLNESILQSNALAASRLDASQAALTDVATTVQGVLDALVGLSDGMTSGAATVAQAKAALGSLTSSLNAELAGVQLFSGDDAARPSLVEFYADAGSPARTSIEAAFVGAFGVFPDDPAVAAISSSQMSSFLDGAFAAQFADPAWGTNWSGASSTNASSRIAAGESIEISANANEAPFRKFAQAYSMMAELGGVGLNLGAFKAIAERATALVGSAIVEVDTIRARLGTSQERVKSADDRLAIAGRIMTNALNKAETIDPYQAAVTVNTIMNQLQASYSATARIQQLSILNYL